VPQGGRNRGLVGGEEFELLTADPGGERPAVGEAEQVEGVVGAGQGFVHPDREAGVLEGDRLAVLLEEEVQRVGVPVHADRRRGGRVAGPQGVERPLEVDPVPVRHDVGDGDGRVPPAEVSGHRPADPGQPPDQVGPGAGGGEQGEGDGDQDAGGVGVPVLPGEEGEHQRTDADDGQHAGPGVRLRGTGAGHGVSGV
jgi:hypothetical protein